MPSLPSRFVYWIPAICVGGIISLFSTRYFSANQTAHVVIPILHWLLPRMSQRELHISHILIRKLAHVIEFGFFSIAVFHGIRGPRLGWQWNWAITTLFVAVAYAGLDEWHQSFVPLREPRVRDVVIDSFGALLAQSLVWLYAKWHPIPADSTGVRAISE